MEFTYFNINNASSRRTGHVLRATFIHGKGEHYTRSDFTYDTEPELLRALAVLRAQRQLLSGHMTWNDLEAIPGYYDAFTTVSQYREHGERAVEVWNEESAETEWPSDHRYDDEPASFNGHFELFYHLGDLWVELELNEFGEAQVNDLLAAMQA